MTIMLPGICDYTFFYALVGLTIGVGILSLIWDAANLWKRLRRK